MANDDDCRLLQVIYSEESSSKVRASREGGRRISIEVCCKTDEENCVMREGGVEECPGVMPIDPGVASSIVQSGRSTCLRESRRREREKRCRTKGCAVLARRRCEMSLVVEKNENVCGLYTNGPV